MSSIDSQLASTSFSIAPPSDPLGSLDHRAVVEFTQRLFGRTPSVSLEVDPETSEKSFLVIAPAQGSVDELVALNDKWHRELRAAVGNAADHYRLMIDPQ